MNEKMQENLNRALDDGKIVYGCEFGGSEMEVKDSICDRKVVMVDINEVRKEWEIFGR